MFLDARSSKRCYQYANDDITTAFQSFPIAARYLRPTQRHSIREKHLGLIAVIGDGVGFGALNATVPDHVKPDGTHERRLGLSFPGLNPGMSEPAATLRITPAEERPDDKDHPVKQMERLTFLRACRDGEHSREEPESPVCLLYVEIQAPLMSVLQIVQMALASCPDIPSCDDFA